VRTRPTAYRILVAHHDVTINMMAKSVPDDIPEAHGGEGVLTRTSERLGAINCNNR
jgi:hypothetical protein